MRIFLITLSILLTSIGSIMAKNLYNFSIQDIDGNTVNLDKFKGKPILLVNTASRCGFTKQYANLSNLHREYFKKNLVISEKSFNHSEIIWHRFCSLIRWYIKPKFHDEHLP